MSVKVWIVDDDSSIRWVLNKALSGAHYECTEFDNAEDVLNYQETHTPDIVISDIRMPGIDGLELLSRIHEKDPDIPVIIMTAHSDLSSAVNAYQSGTFEYLPKPFDLDVAIDLIKRAELSIQEKQAKRKKEELEDTQISSEIIGEASAMQEVFRAIGRLSKSSISVLINGQSGTGKELVAHALHKHSPRKDKPFIPLNMAAIPRELIESELFGHEKGAFTGATSAYQGRFEQADGGTLFLDEIGDMPIDVQTRLLRVLADGCFYRVGGHQSIKVDVRIIAATNKNLEKEVEEGRFREDLFHRLNVIRIHIPPLKDRREDIPILAKSFLKRIGAELNIEVKILRPETAAYLSTLPWPGNVRQLENVCRWLTVMASGQEIHISDLPSELTTPHVPENTPEIKTQGAEETAWQSSLQNWARRALNEGKENLLGEAVPQFESIMLKTALEYTRNHKQEAARLLGWGRNTLTRKLHELHLED